MAGPALELELYAMKKEASGDARLADRSEEPDFYDVALKRVNHDTGEIDIVEEYEDLSLAEALAKAQEIEDRTGLEADFISG